MLLNPRTHEKILREITAWDRESPFEFHRLDHPMPVVTRPNDPISPVRRVTLECFKGYVMVPNPHIPEGEIIFLSSDQIRDPAEVKVMSTRV